MQQRSDGHSAEDLDHSLDKVSLQENFLNVNRHLKLVLDYLNEPLGFLNDVLVTVGIIINLIYSQKKYASQALQKTTKTGAQGALAHWQSSLARQGGLPHHQEALRVRP